MKKHIWISTILIFTMLFTSVPAFAAGTAGEDNSAAEPVTGYTYVPGMESGYSSKVVSDMDNDGVDEVKYVIKPGKDITQGIYKVIIKNAEVNLLGKNNKVRLNVGQEGANSDLIDVKSDNKINIVMDNLPEDSTISVKLIPEKYIEKYTKFSKKNFESGKWKKGYFKVGRDIPAGKYIALKKKGNGYIVDGVGACVADSLYDLQNGKYKSPEVVSLTKNQWVKVNYGLYKIIEDTDTSKTLKISATKTTIYVGAGTKKLSVNGPVNGKTVTWKSSNNKIAAVNKYGTLTAKKAGKAIITAKCGTKTFKCAVTVKNPVKYKYTRSTKKHYSKKTVEKDSVYTYDYKVVGGKDIPAGIYKIKAKDGGVNNNSGGRINQDLIQIRKNQAVRVHLVYKKGVMDGYCTLIPEKYINGYTKYSLSDMKSFEWMNATYKVGRDIAPGTYVDTTTTWMSDETGTKKIINVAVADTLYGVIIGKDSFHEMKPKITKSFKDANGKYYKGGQVFVLKKGQWVTTSGRIYRIK